MRLAREGYGRFRKRTASQLCDTISSVIGKKEVWLHVGSVSFTFVFCWFRSKLRPLPILWNRQVSLFFFFFFFWLLRAAPVAYGRPQAGVKSELQLLPVLQPQQCRLQATSATCAGSFNPLSEARDRTHNLMDTICVHSSLSHERNSMVSPFFCLWPWKV